MDGPTITLLALLGAILLFFGPFIISDWLAGRKK